MCRRSCRETFYVLLFKDFSGHSAFSLIFHDLKTGQLSRYFNLLFDCFGFLPVVSCFIL